jgi:Ca2+-binding EF-hand superfamily protein
VTGGSLSALRQMFVEIDKNGNGSIEAIEFKQALRELGITVTEEEVN